MKGRKRKDGEAGGPRKMFLVSCSLLRGGLMHRSGLRCTLRWRVAGEYGRSRGDRRPDDW